MAAQEISGDNRSALLRISGAQATPPLPLTLVCGGLSSLLSFDNSAAQDASSLQAQYRSDHFAFARRNTTGRLSTISSCRRPQGSSSMRHGLLSRPRVHPWLLWARTIAANHKWHVPAKRT